MNPNKRIATALVGLVLFVGGCAGVHDATGTASQRDFADLREEFQALSTNIQRAQRQAQSSVDRIDQRTQNDIAETRNLLRALGTRLERIESHVNTLATRVEEINQRVDGVRRPGTQPPVTSAAPPAGSPIAPGPSVGVPTPAPPPAGSASPSPRPATGALQPQDVYQMAYLDFSKGSYALAIEGFREFIRRFPRDDHADDAQYWIGESHLALARSYEKDQPERATEELKIAVREFRKVIANYPRGEKVPTALYREALTLLELKQTAQARSSLQYLVDNFPRAEEAPLARERLTALPR
jgi:tol-pal system protein YbgF